MSKTRTSFDALAFINKPQGSAMKTRNKRWSFNGQRRMSEFLQSSSLNLGIRPLSPPRMKKRHSTNMFTNEPVLKEDKPPIHLNKKIGKRANYFEDEPYKKTRKVGRKRDCLGMLPDEMVLKILKNLPKQTLGQVALVNKRLSRLVRDESLWEKIDCIGLELEISVVLQRNPQYLRLARAVIFPLSPLPPLPQTGIKYLDLTMADVPPPTLAQLLFACPQLTHLSLEHVTCSQQVTKAMKSFSKNIQVLNLSMCYGLDAEGLSEVLRLSGSLTQLNLSYVIQKWTENELMMIVGALPPSLEQLNLSGFRHVLRDPHTHLLSARLPKLLELDLSDSQELTGQTLEYLSSLKYLQHLSLSRCYSIEPGSYAILCGVNSLRYLEVFSLFKESSVKNLAASLNNIEINQLPFSAVARPTVGNRRSSIWGVRVRE